MVLEDGQVVGRVKDGCHRRLGPFDILGVRAVVLAVEAHEGARGGVVAGPAGGLRVFGVVHAKVAPVTVEAQYRS